ncbi:MAG: hypothetical protein HYV42_02890 [Candidatus Magasanikbacteria bacterium]|nr:hypothetical protein [Candidatus Magasanikbacteria bacterium]
MFAVDILRRGSAGAQLAEKKAEQATLGTRQEKIMQELHFSEEERWWVKMAQLCAAFQPYRKARQFKSCSHMEKYFREVARRLYISLDQARYLTHYEVAEALRKGEVDTNLLNERRKFFVYIFDNNQPRCLTGSPAEAWYQEHVAQEMHQFSGELRGTVACPGRATGKVRMVNSYEEGQQFQPGEILVSFSTNPTLLPAMRLAAAIITEEGGLTCHAAIVSRELNIPCVVGIKGIVSGLQTGETIEVDAIKGLVKKLS